MVVHWIPSSLSPSKKLALRLWKNRYQSSRPPRGLLWILHGLGEHVGRYSELAQFLNRAGFDVAGLDHLGHGLTALEGGLTDLGSFPEMLQEQEHALQKILVEGLENQVPYQDSPWFLVGHSMGALLGLYWIARGKSPHFLPDFAKRAFFAAPPFRLLLKVPGWKNVMSSRMNSLLPHLKVPNGIRVEDLTYDILNQRSYEEDPLVQRHSSPHNYESMRQTAAEVSSQVQNIEIPVCFAVGKDDPVVDPEAIVQFYERTSTHKKLLLFENRKHEIFNDLNKEQVWLELVKWIG